MLVFFKILLGLLTILFSFIGIGITILTSKNIINEDAIQKAFDWCVELKLIKKYD